MSIQRLKNLTDSAGTSLVGVLDSLDQSRAEGDFAEVVELAQAAVLLSETIETLQDAVQTVIAAD